MPVSCSTADPSPEPPSALRSSQLGLICLTIVLLGVDVVALVGKLGRFSEGTSSDLIFLPWDFLKCLLHTTVGIDWQILSSYDMDPLLQKRLVGKR